jgi:cell division protein FtsB
MLASHRLSSLLAAGNCNSHHHSYSTSVQSVETTLPLHCLKSRSLSVCVCATRVHQAAAARAQALYDALQCEVAESAREQELLAAKRQRLEAEAAQLQEEHIEAERRRALGDRDANEVHVHVSSWESIRNSY